MKRSPLKKLKTSFLHDLGVLLLAFVVSLFLFGGSEQTSSQIMRVGSFQKISSTTGGLVGPIADGDGLGWAATNIGDLDGDGVTDVAVGSGIGFDEGTIWILFLNSDGTVKDEQEITEGVGGFSETLDGTDDFGTRIVNMGDLDGDTVVDLAVAADSDDDGGSDRGAFYFLYLNTDGTVKASKKISDISGGFAGGLENGDTFASGLTSIGDLNGDGSPDIAVGAAGDGMTEGAVWILFLDASEDVIGFQKIAEGTGGFIGELEDGDAFGFSVTSIGDLNDDGVIDLAVGAIGDDDGGLSTGAVYILFMNTDGTVKAQQKISTGNGGFTGTPGGGSGFGIGAAATGDLNGDGILDLLVGMSLDPESAAAGGANAGAVWTLFMNSDGTVKFWEKLGDREGALPFTLDDFDLFGTGLNKLGDLNGDGYPDFIVGAPGDDDGGSERGAAYILFTRPDFADPRFIETDSYVQITDGLNGFTGDLDDFDNFGGALDTIGDLDGDGVIDLAVGVPLDDDGGDNRGAMYILFMNSDGTVKSHQKISDTEGGFTGTLDDFDQFGLPANIGDLDNDGVIDLAVASFLDDDGGNARGAIFVLFMNTDGTVKSHQKISDTEGNFTAPLDNVDLFGVRVAGIGDLNGDGIEDILTAASNDDDAFTDAGAVYILFMNTNGTVKSYSKITEGVGGFTGPINTTAGNFGFDVEGIGDLNGDGVTDIAVGEPFNDDEDASAGAVWILFLNSNGTVKGQQKISDTEGNFFGELDAGDLFGAAIESLGDMDYDGIQDIAVGALTDDDGDVDNGATWILYLNKNGTVKRYEKLSETDGNFTGPLDGDEWFATPETMGDLNGDGFSDLAVSAYRDEGPVGGTNQGSVFIIFREPDFDRDGLVASDDEDDDNDGIPDVIEGSGDIDADGIRNMSDLDSDGDGVPDALEANGGVRPDNMDFNGQFELEYALLNDVDGDGLVADVDPDEAGTALAVPDSDGDGVANFLDIDSDNDGIPDVFEFQSTADYFPPLFDETDGDGLDDAVDPDSGGTPLIPVDTDGDGTEDFIDTDADNDGIVDSIEGNDVNADGKADIVMLGTDSDGDGLDDAWDTMVAPAVANARGTRVKRQNTDASGDVDYRDTDDDGDNLLTSVECTQPSNCENADNDAFPDYLDTFNNSGSSGGSGGGIASGGGGAGSGGSGGGSGGSSGSSSGGSGGSSGGNNGGSEGGGDSGEGWGNEPPVNQPPVEEPPAEEPPAEEPPAEEPPVEEPPAEEPPVEEPPAEEPRVEEPPVEEPPVEEPPVEEPPVEEPPVEEPFSLGVPRIVPSLDDLIIPLPDEDILSLDLEDLEPVEERVPVRRVPLEPPPEEPAGDSECLDNQDRDGDGLTDQEECELGSNPLLRDSDGDGVDDQQELLDFGRLALLEPGQKKDRVTIVAPENGQTLVDTSPFIRGFAPAMTPVTLIATNSAGFTQELGTASVSENGIFLFETPFELRDDTYVVVARQAGLESEDVAFTIDTTLDLQPPDLTYLDNEDLVPVLLEGLRIEIVNNKPILYGTTEIGNKVVATWNSVVTSSALIADAREFSMPSPRVLELGEHAVYVSALRRKDNVQSATIKVPFTLLEEDLKESAPEEDSFGPWLWGGGILILLIISALVLFFQQQKAKRKDQKLSS